ncbi:hypothetical protein [Streptomyces sp. NPDC059649]|uniref:hypothetical protein n=1 Tax=Streptomyces sp. NPDC059649 TaxID=3346895 RepID=UPI00368D94B1
MGGPAVLAEQLHHLLALHERLPHLWPALGAHERRWSPADGPGPLHRTSRSRRR